MAAAPVAAAPATAVAPITAPAVPSELALSWSLTTLVNRCTEAVALARQWTVGLPGEAASLFAELQLRVRNLAAESNALFARLLPFVSDTPDLTPLVASPVPGVESSGFGWRRDPIHRHSKFHKGTDFRADRGTPVYAAGIGIVAFTGRQHGYGNVIYVDHGGGLVTRYAHLSRIEVKAGVAIEAGGQIGRVGATGRATGPHLHFEVRVEGRAVDPTLAMQVAGLQRVDPEAARLAALGLAPELQALNVDRHDPVRARGPRTADRGKRPERRGAPTRNRTLW